MSNNGNLGGCIADGELSGFDELPAEIRRAFADAPYDLAFTDVAAQLSELGRPLNQAELAYAVEAIQEEHGFELGVTAYALYGADHPQARAVSAACLSDLNLLATFNLHKLWRAGKRVSWPTSTSRPAAAIAPSFDIDFVPLHADRPRRRGRIKDRDRAKRALYDPRRDGLPVFESTTAEAFGDPPIGRRAVDMR